MRVPEPESRGADPVRVFVILAAILVAIGTLFLMIRSGSTPERVASTPANEAPDFSLTDAEALARFKELDALRVQAIDTADVSLLDQVFVQGAAIYRVTEKNIRRLKRSGVTATHEPYFDKSLAVLENEGDGIRIEQVVLFDVVFTDTSGRNLTRGGGREEQRIIWSLASETNEWLIGAARVIEATPR